MFFFFSNKYKNSAFLYDSGVKKHGGQKNRGSKKHGVRFFNGQIHRQFFGIFTKIVNF